MEGLLSTGLPCLVFFFCYCYFGPFFNFFTLGIRTIKNPSNFDYKLLTTLWFFNWGRANYWAILWFFIGKKLVYDTFCWMSSIICHLSPDHRSIQLQLLWESQDILGWCGWTRFGDWLSKKPVLFSLQQKLFFCQFIIREFKEEPWLTRNVHPSPFRSYGGWTERHPTDIANYRQNRPRVRFCENCFS